MALAATGTRTPVPGWHWNNDPCPWLAPEQGPGAARGSAHLTALMVTNQCFSRTSARGSHKQGVSLVLSSAPAAKAAPRSKGHFLKVKQPRLCNSKVPPSHLCAARHRKCQCRPAEVKIFLLTHYSYLQSVPNQSLSTQGATALHVSPGKLVPIFSLHR